MKMMRKNLSPPVEQPVFHKVAENLYRLESSGEYYALIKKGGKQFRRSLKTKDRKLADRRLKEFKEQIGGLSLSDDAKLVSAADQSFQSGKVCRSQQATIMPIITGSFLQSGRGA